MFQDRAGRWRHDDDVVAQANRLVDRVGDKEHTGFLLSPQREQQFLHSQARARVKRTERLVHQHDAWLEDQRARDRYALAHAAGQLMGKLIGVAIFVEANFAQPFHRLSAPV